MLNFLKKFLAVLSAISLLVVVPLQAYASYNLFQSVNEVESSDLSPFSKWTGVLERYKSQEKEPAVCEGKCQEQAWQKLLGDLDGKDEMSQMKEVNRFFNKVRYIEDEKNFGMKDHWQTPREFMQRGGDCEDYAIAKYLSLKQLGFSASQMRIVIVQDKNLGGIMHAVLEVSVNHKRYLLDNQVKQVVAESDIFHYRPVYSINETAWWAYNAK